MTSPALSFEPSSISLKPGEQKIINVYLDPASVPIVGIDLFLKYDPAFIKVLDLNSLNVFSSQTGKVIGADTVRYALSNDVGKHQTASGIIATITLEGINEGVSDLKFVAMPGSTADTNIIADHGVDVLKDTGNLSLVISPPPGGVETSHSSPLTLPKSSTKTIKPLSNITPVSPTVLGAKTQAEILEVPTQILNSVAAVPNFFWLPLAIGLIFLGSWLFLSNLPKTFLSYKT